MKLSTFFKRLSEQEQAQFCALAGTTHNHVRLQLLGGHRAASLRMLWALVNASQQMFPTESHRWLTLQHMHVELEALRQRRASGAIKRSNKGAKA